METKTARYRLPERTTNKTGGVNYPSRISFNYDVEARRPRFLVREKSKAKEGRVNSRSLAAEGSLQINPSDSKT